MLLHVQPDGTRLTNTLVLISRQTQVQFQHGVIGIWYPTLEKHLDNANMAFGVFSILIIMLKTWEDEAG